MLTPTVKSALEYIYAMNNDELSYLMSHINARRSEIALKNRIAFNVGDAVSFSGRGKTYSGKITGIKIKNAIVKDGNGVQWRVPLNILRVA